MPTLAFGMGEWERWSKFFTTDTADKTKQLQFPCCLTATPSQHGYSGICAGS
jgi:hypothetical protein